MKKFSYYLVTTLNFFFMNLNDLENLNKLKQAINFQFLRYYQFCQTGLYDINKLQMTILDKLIELQFILSEVHKDKSQLLSPSIQQKSRYLNYSVIGSLAITSILNIASLLNLKPQVTSSTKYLLILTSSLAGTCVLLGTAYSYINYIKTTLPPNLLSEIVSLRNDILQKQVQKHKTAKNQKVI